MFEKPFRIFDRKGQHVYSILHFHSHHGCWHAVRPGPCPTVQASFNTIDDALDFFKEELKEDPAEAAHSTVQP